MTEVKFLGHVVSSKRILVDLAKTNRILQWEQPKNMIEIPSFLGLSEYYCQFNENFSQIAIPLTKLTQKTSSLSRMTIMSQLS